MATEQNQRDRKTLLTSDGKGAKAKEEALERLLNKDDMGFKIEGLLDKLRASIINEKDDVMEVIEEIREVKNNG
jgi:hypothetical protein